MSCCKGINVIMSPHVTHTQESTHGVSPCLNGGLYKHSHRLCAVTFIAVGSLPERRVGISAARGMTNKVRRVSEGSGAMKRRLHCLQHNWHSCFGGIISLKSSLDQIDSVISLYTSISKVFCAIATFQDRGSQQVKLSRNRIRGTNISCCHLNGKNHEKKTRVSCKDFHKPTPGKHRKTIVQCHFSSCQCPSKTLTTLSSFGRRGFVASRCCLGHGHRWDHVVSGGRDGVR